MDRSRSKRSYHYGNNHANDDDFPPRSRPRYNPSAPAPAPAYHHRRDRRSGPDRRGPPPPPPPPPLPPAALTSSSSPRTAAAAAAANGSSHAASGVTTSFRILCPDAMAGGVIGKSGAVINSFRQETGAWISVHQLLHGDDERVIETSDNRRREPDGRPPQYSPAQEALLLIHERIVDELDRGGGSGGGSDDGGYGGRGGERDRGKVTTRLVVPRTHVGCLLGKGGKIIEQMKMDTKTHIRILPRDQFTPRCVSASEEIVQVVGEGHFVKKAVMAISSRLKESLHRDRGPFRGRLYSPDRYNDDEPLNKAQILSADEEYELGSRFSTRSSRNRNNSYESEPPGFAFDTDGNAAKDRFQSFCPEEIIFRILCPKDKVETLIGVQSGIIEMLRSEVGVDVNIADTVPGSDEQVIVITSGEDPDDDLFPAQEALLHIQTHIADLGPDKDNIITTRLLVPASEIACLEGKYETLSDLRSISGANIQILTKEECPPCVKESDKLIQIVGEIRAARSALLNVTANLRDNLYRDISAPKDMLQPPVSARYHDEIAAAHEFNPNAKALTCEASQESNPLLEISQSMHAATTGMQQKDSGTCASGSSEQKSNGSDDGRHNSGKRFSVPLVTKSTLEVVIPEHAVPSLLMRSGNKLAQISELSGAAVTLVQDGPEQPEKTVKISGSPEQAEKAQSLLLGFILSTQDDNAPS